jgi:hypothetical protein
LCTSLISEELSFFSYYYRYIKYTLEKTEGANKNGQSRENRRGNQEWTIQRKQMGQSRMDNPEKTEGAINNGQSRENRRGNQEWTIQRKQKEQSINVREN